MRCSRYQDTPSENSLEFLALLCLTYLLQIKIDLLDDAYLVLCEVRLILTIVGNPNYHKTKKFQKIYYFYEIEIVLLQKIGVIQRTFEL